MSQGRIQVSARISKELYDKCIHLSDNMTCAINTGLELLCKQSENNNENICNTSENSNGELMARVEEKDSRIEDMKLQVQALYEQLRIKDEQLQVKDNQIEKLNENMHKQAVHIQTLIQENSKLNMKLLPETIEVKQPWYKFWKSLFKMP